VKILYLGLVVLLLLAFLLTGCGKASTTTPPKTSITTTPVATTSQVPTTSKTTSPPTSAAPQTGGTLTLIDDRPANGTLGWFAEPGPPAGSFYFLIFEALASPQYSGQVLPQLASSWDIAPDQTSITFHLQQNVKFHDESDFNATVAKWNIDVFIAAHMPATQDISSVDVVDTYTMKVNLSTYHNTILYDISGIPMVSKAAYDANGGANGGKEYLRWHPVGTGPFKMDTYTTDQSIKCVKFTDYWQKGKPNLDAVTVTWVADPNTAAASLQAGEADAMIGNSPQIFSNLKQKGFNIISTFTGAITLIPDSKNSDSPLANEKVREAIDYAINRDGLVKAKGYGMWVTTYQFADPNTSAYIRDLPPRTYNPDKAKALLTEAGYSNGFSMTLYGDSSTTDKDTTVAMQSDLEAIGIKVDLAWLDYAGFVQYVMQGWKNGMLVCANGFAPNMNSGIDFVWSQKAMFFPSVLKTDTDEQLIDAARSAKDYDPALVQKILKEIYDEVMFSPVYCIIRGVATTTKVHDSGFLIPYGPSSWQPANAWLSK
jgi:peptide/nickel transport system substrate-binding protein